MDSRYDGYLFGGVAGGLDYATREALARKANVNNPAFTGQVSMTNLQISSDGSVQIPNGALPIAATDDLQTSLDGKATLGADVSFHDLEADGTVNFPASVSCGNLFVSGTVSLPNNSLSIQDTANLATILDSKASINNPVFTGTVTVPSASKS